MTMMTSSSLFVSLAFSGLACLAAASSGSPAPAKKLNDGLSFPVVSFGLQVYDDDTAYEYTSIALKSGIRNFFSSVLAGNQAGFGRAIASSTVPRPEIFICGSVNTGQGGCSGYSDCLTQTAQGCQDNLQAINVTYLDQIMLDYPADDCGSILGQWQAFESMLSSGKTKSIAVSNFAPEQLDCIVKNKSSTVPAVNQMQYSVGSGKDTTIEADEERGGIFVQAYSPLQSGSLASDPDCLKIGKKYNKSAAQVALRWILQRGASFTTSASTAEFFEEDLDLFDFNLTESDMTILNNK